MPFFQEAERVIVNGGNFVDNGGVDNRKGEGVKLLLSYVQSEAIHDSDSRGDLGCHPGTREEYIRNITSWGRGEWESEKRAFLMTGPAGAGKSAIARTCARKLKATGILGASFFFYRPSLWNDPKKFVPTIVYQLTTQYSAYRDCIDAVVLDDPLVLEKEMSIQFLELLVKPLLQPSVNGHNVETDLVIVVDGLDECATVDAQLQIIRLITTSIHERTTPFLWAFFSRPEPPITSAFASRVATSISWALPLTLSGNAENDIDAYLRGSFEVVRTKHNIPTDVAWPAEADIRRIISQAAGLFVYAATAIRYIDGLGAGRAGLEERLRAVARMDSTSRESPFSALDRLYTLLMTLIPEGVIYDTLSLLYLDQVAARGYNHYWSGSQSDDEHPKIPCYCVALGLSSAAFHVAIGNLYSVLQVTKSSTGALATLKFYHKSFLDFLLDPTRSKQYFLRAPEVRKHCLEMVVRSLCTTRDIDNTMQRNCHAFVVQSFFAVVEGYAGKLEENILQQILQVDWIYGRLGRGNYIIDFKTFIQKIPKDWRHRIIRPSCYNYISPFNFRRERHLRDIFFHLSREMFSHIQLQILATLMPEQYEATGYIIGQGDKECLLQRDLGQKYWGMVRR